MNNGAKPAERGACFECTTLAPEETILIGSDLATILSAGTVILLSGELGAGKTVFAQGVAAGLGVAAPVTSPTYTLVSEYQGRLIPFYHMDLYRLGGGDPFEELGAEEYVHSDGVTAIEWPEQVRSRWRGDCLTVSIKHLGGDSRKIEMAGTGARSNAVLENYVETFARSGTDG